MSGPGIRRRGWSLVATTSAALCVGFAFRRVFGTSEVLLTATLSAIVPPLVVLACSGGPKRFVTDAEKARATRPLWPSLVLSALAWMLVVSASLFRDLAVGHVIPTPAGMRDIATAVVDAPKSILTTVLPAPADGELLVLVSACVWVAALAGAELALRTATVSLPALPALLALIVPVILGVGGPGSNLPVVVAMIGAIGLLLLIRAPERLPPLGTALVGVPIVIALSCVAALLGPDLPGTRTRRPPDLRDLVALPQPERLTGISPLDRISAWLMSPDQPMFSVDGPSAPDRYWRLTVLDRYDGSSWYPVRNLRVTAGRVPESPDGRPPVLSTVVNTVTVRDLGDIWLPGTDRPTEVDAPGLELRVDPDSGVIASGSGLRSGTRYRIDARVPALDPDRLQFLPAAQDPANTALPESDAMGRPIPALESLRAKATVATSGSTFPYQQALRLAQWLRANHRYDISAVPGHSYRNLQFFLETTKEGTSEQFATAFAVMARTLNLPSRVVVGFSAGREGANGVREVRSGDIVAWPEVEFEGVGWVPFFPTPGQATDSGTRKQAPEQKAPATSAPAKPVTRAEKDREIAGQARSGPAPDTAPRSTAHRAGTRWWLFVAAGVGTGVVGYLAAAGLGPVLARRRRRRGEPREQVIGAWRQINDDLVGAGLRTSGSLTVGEIADYGASRLPPEAGARLPELASLVNDIAYGDRRIEQADADAAWRDRAIVAGAVRRIDGRPRPHVRAYRRMRPRSVALVFRSPDKGRE
ncbi:transglutaminase family protein [Embleya sp. NPDC055664]